MAYISPSDVTAGSVLTASRYNQDVIENVEVVYNSIKRIGFQSRATDYTVDQTALSSAAEIFSADITFTADGTSTYILECFFPAVDSTASGRQVLLHFTDGSNTSLLGAVSGVTSNAGAARTAVHVKHFWTPTSGSKSVNMKAINTGGTGNLFQASATWANAWLALWGPVQS